MKNIKIVLVVALSICVLGISAQEKKIKFSKGTLKICSSKNFTIEGYDGDEVIIKSLHDKRVSNIMSYGINGNTRRSFTINSGTRGSYKTQSGFGRVSDSIKTNGVYFLNNDSNRKKGLKKLGKNNENKDLGIYFEIEEKDGELIFKDISDGQLVMISNEKYEIKIPNSIKLNWLTNGCQEKEILRRNYVFYNSKASSLSNFDGEVEISTSLNNMELIDVTGPVSINSIGGNVTIAFDKKIPKKLYSIYSNNGFIDITLPTNSSLKLDATASDIFSDINFELEDEKVVDNLQQMKLKLNSGKVTMKLNAGLGNIYLRKK